MGGKLDSVRVEHMLTDNALLKNIREKGSQKNNI